MYPQNGKVQKRIMSRNRDASGQSISRILSNGFFRFTPRGASSLRTPSGRSSLWAARHRAARCGLPGTGTLPLEGAHKETSSLPSSADDIVPAWPCSRRWLPGHPHYCGRRWSLTPPFHPHPPIPKGMRAAVCFLWPFSAG
jgi:hypothetical protein